MNTTTNKLICINSNDLTNDYLINGNDSGVGDWSDSTLTPSQPKSSKHCIQTDPEVNHMNSSDNKLICINNNDIINDNLINGNGVVAIELSDSVPQTAQSLSVQKSMAQVVLVCRKNSHPFNERRLNLEPGQSAKVGRAVARCKPSADNFVFDCKVLSRNHAILSFENQKFYLKDTCSSNGTFVNNQRLSVANEESVPREVFSGDIVQFGVDVTENTRKVTHGCIIAALKLYFPDGTEAKTQEPQQHCPQNTNQTNVCITSQQLYELSQYLNEALHRERILENKLETLERVVCSANESANSGWKSLVEEDRLLSRIETLQNKLEICLNSQQNSKESTDNTDTSLVLQNVRAEVLKLIDDREKYETAAKEAIQKALEEKLIVLTRLHELEVSIKSHEEECNRLQEVCETSAQEINRLVNNNDELNKEIDSYVKRLKTFEDQKIALIEATTKEKEELEENISKLRAKEEENNSTIDELKLLNAAANCQIEKLLLQLEVSKQSTKVITDGNNESIGTTDNTYVCSDFKVNLEEELKKVKKQLELSNNNCNELNAEVTRLKLQTESTVTLTQSTTASMIESVSDYSSSINGQISSTNTDSIASTDGSAPVESVISTIETTTDSSAQQQQQQQQPQQESVPLNQTTSQQLSSEIDILKELLAETRASKKSLEEELSRNVTELENLRSLTKQMSIESEESQHEIEKLLKELEEKAVFITSLKNQINDLTEKIRNSVNEKEAIMSGVEEYEKLIHLKNEELSSLRVLLEEERKVQQKYVNNYEQCRKQLSETQIAVKQSQTESELLRKKVYSCNEELRTSRTNLSVTNTVSEELQTKQKEFEKLQNECQSLKNKLQTRESELISYRTQHQKLSADYECLQNSMQLLQKINCEIEQRGDNYWKEQFNTAKTDAQTQQTQLINVRKELEELKQKFDVCYRDKESFKEELLFAKEDIEVFSYQSKIATACAFVPLFMLLIAILMAYYPSVSTVTGTTDL